MLVPDRVVQGSRSISARQQDPRAGVRKVVEDSSGNAGAAIAAYCAKASVACHIYVPGTTPPAKLMQIKRYGAHLHLVKGDREAAAQAALHQACTTYYASHYWNPFFIHGTKTCVFEIVEQLTWKPPDLIIVPVGNGTLLLGCYIGLRDLLDEGVIDTLPRVIGVQAANCAPLAFAWNHDGDLPSDNPARKTMAEGIAIRNPPRAREILDAIHSTHGEIITVNEKEIRDALRFIWRKGYYIEPTSAVALAALGKYRIPSNQVVVIPLTGHGLKQGK